MPETTPALSATPLAAYVEQLPQVRREFTLYTDRVEVRARWAFGRRHVTTVPLADLAPRTANLTIRNKLVKRSITCGSLAVAAAVVFAQPTYSPALRSLAPAGWSVAIVCFGLAAMAWRKIRFVRFFRSDGRPALDIGAAGPQVRNFEPFLEQVRREIRRQR